jgi:hypothetical protein
MFQPNKAKGIKMPRIGMIISFWLALVSYVPAANALPFGFGKKTEQNSIPVARYADVADLVTISPLVVDATVTKVTKVPPAQTIGVPADIRRVVADATVNALVRGQQGIVPRIRFLFDLRKNSAGEFPDIKKLRFFFMANYTGTPGTIKLVTPKAFLQYSPENDATVRRVTREAVMLDAPRRLTGIASAFYTAGTVIGEGQSQIFLDTEGNQPMSITVNSRADSGKSWSVSTSELVGESASVPQKQTLLWYRLACGLPRSMPDDVIAGSEADTVSALKDDYAFVLAKLGSCRG